MKRTSLLLTSYFLLLAASAPAQQPGYEPHDTKTEKQYKWGIGLQVNTVRRISQLDEFLVNINNADGTTKDKSYSLGVTSYYYFNKNLALRIRGDITKTNINYYSKQPVILSIGNINLSQTNLEVAIGGTWIYQKDKIAFGVGFEIPIGFYGDFTQLDDSEDSNGILSKDKIVIPGGNSYGIGAFGNFNVYIFKNISAGFQISTALLYYKIGGNTSEEGWIYDANGNLTDYQFITRETKVEQFSLTNPIASLNISIWF